MLIISCISELTFDADCCMIGNTSASSLMLPIRRQRTAVQYLQKPSSICRIRGGRSVAVFSTQMIGSNC